MFVCERRSLFPSLPAMVKVPTLLHFKKHAIWFAQARNYSCIVYVTWRRRRTVRDIWFALSTHSRIRCATSQKTLRLSKIPPRRARVSVLREQRASGERKPWPVCSSFQRGWPVPLVRRCHVRTRSLFVVSCFLLHTRHPKLLKLEKHAIWISHEKPYICILQTLCMHPTDIVDTGFVLGGLPNRLPCEK